MRIVLIGTKKKLVVPSEKDLALADWNNSYFKYVLFDGLDLRGKGLNNTDFINCQVLNCDLSGCEMRWMVSRRTSWKGSTLSEKLSARALVSCHDVVAELLEQAIPTQTGRLREAEEAALAYILSSYHTSWPDTAYELIKRQGFTVDEVVRGSEAAFGHIPGLIHNWRYILQNGGPWKINPVVLQPNVAAFGLSEPQRPELVEDINTTLAGSVDRGVARVRIKALMGARWPQADWLVQVYQADEYGLTVAAWPKEDIRPELHGRWDFWEAYLPPEAYRD